MTNETRREKKARLTRQAIINAAMILFKTHGFEQTTMRQIATAAEVATGTVFNYFEDKHALLYEVLYDDLEQTKQRSIETMPPDSAGIIEQLEHLALSFYRYYATRPALSRVLLKEAMFAQPSTDGTPSWGERFEAQVASVGVVVQANIARAVARGELDAQTDVALGALTFFSHYYFILLWGINQPTPQLLDQQRRLRALLMQWYRGTCTTQEEA